MSTILRWRWAVPVVAIACGVLTLAVALSGPLLDGVLHQHGPGGPVADWLTTAVPLVSAAAVGSLVAARRPRNPIGWIILAIFFSLPHQTASTPSWTTGCTTEGCRLAG